MSGPKIKLLAVILLPVLVASVVLTSLVLVYSRQLLTERTLELGNAAADQLALTITDALVQQDALRLNVMLSNLLARGNFKFASVYTPDGKLLAQVGKSEASMATMSRDVAFQDAAAGVLQVGLRADVVDARVDRIALFALLLHLVVFGLLGFAVLYYGDFLLFWIAAPPARAALRDIAAPDHAIPEPVESAEPEQAPSPDRTTMLIAKIRPVRQLEANLSRIYSALRLYRCETEVTDGDDLVLTFEGTNQTFDAVCCALLLKSLMALRHPSITVRLGMNTVRVSGGDSALEKSRKHATYLASIAERGLLASRQVAELAAGNPRLTFREFKSSLAPDGEVYYLDNVDHASREVIERQARQFA
ncbi:MAG: hypothetical protein KDI19_05095 [Pseudomonadales bacterium]|nr:hypothetical protein [Pseudomonadales bacterium]